jgi:hypothetical protein
MHFSTLAFLAGLFVASTNAVVTPVPEICCISGGGPDPCGSVVGKPLLMNPVPLASLPPTSICCCSAANDLNCRNICGCKYSLTWAWLGFGLTAVAELIANRRSLQRSWYYVPVRRMEASECPSIGRVTGVKFGT